MVMGEGKSPSITHLKKLGQVAKIRCQRMVEIIEQAQTALSGWKQLATEYGVSKANIELVSKRLECH